MKKIIFTAIVAATLCGCAKEGKLMVQPQASSTIQISMNQFSDSEQTKTSITKTGKILWSAGDEISVWPTTPDAGQSATQVKFTICSGDESSSAVFEGTGWGLITDGTRQYVSYYPYVENGLLNRVDVEYTDNLMNPGTTQSVNPPTNISINDFMCSDKVTPSSPESAAFNFKHLGALAKFVITMPTSGRYYGVNISASAPIFVKKGYYDPTSDNPSIIATEYMDNMSYIFQHSGGTAATTETAWFVMAPVDLEEVTLTAIVFNSARNPIYKGEYVCSKAQEAGKMYTYTVNCSAYSQTEPATHEFVDMGTNDGILWSTMNIGSEREWYSGSGFAWGETETKTDYSWSTYKWGNYDSALEPDYGMTKYNATDGKTRLDLEDDAAYVNWDGADTGCRMPTDAEFRRMTTTCSRESGYHHGVLGIWYTAANGNKIFLPSGRYYASSSLYNDETYKSIIGYTYSEGQYKCIGSRLRSSSYSIRPVKQVGE